MIINGDGGYGLLAAYIGDHEERRDRWGWYGCREWSAR